MAPSFVPPNNGGSFTFAPSILPNTATPANNPYAGMNSGASSWTMAQKVTNVRPSTGRPRSDWRTGKGAVPTDIFSADLFPGLATIPKFGPTNTLIQNPPATPFIVPQIPVQSIPPPPPPSDPLIDPQLMVQPPPPSPPSAFIGPEPPEQSASPTSPSNDLIVPEQPKQQVTQNSTAERNSEQYQSQAQEIADLKAALADTDRYPGKYDWVKDNTIRHQRLDIERLTKERNVHRKIADELQRDSKVSLRSQREFRILEAKMKTLEEEKIALQKKCEKDTENMAKNMADIEAKFEDKHLKSEQTIQSLRKQLREAEAEDNCIRAEEAEKKNSQLLEEIAKLKKSNEKVVVAAKEAEKKAKNVKDHAEEERKAMIKSYDSELAEKNKFITEKETLVSKKNEKIVALHGIIEKKDQLLKEMGADNISRKSAEIVELQIMMKEKDRIIEILQRDLLERNEQIVEVKSQKAQLQNELRDKFTSKLDEILMSPIKPLPTLKNASISPKLIQKLTTMVAEENAAHPLSISKMMVTEIKPVMEATILEETESGDEIHDKSAVEGTNDGEKKEDETSDDLNVPGDVVISVDKIRWNRSWDVCERILFFLIGMLMVFITSAVIGFYSDIQLSDADNSAITPMVFLDEHAISVAHVVSREHSEEVFVLNPKKLDLPFQTSESEEYIEIIVEIADIINDLFVESGFHDRYDSYEIETELEIESDSEPNTDSDAESEDSAAHGVGQAHELKVDLMFLGAGVVVCVLMSSALILGGQF